MVLRGYPRHRDVLVTYTGHHIRQIQKALGQRDLKLTEVVSGITGLTGMGMRPRAPAPPAYAAALSLPVAPAS